MREKDTLEEPTEFGTGRIKESLEDALKSIRKMMTEERCEMQKTL